MNVGLVTWHWQNFDSIPVFLFKIENTNLQTTFGDQKIELIYCILLFVESLQSQCILVVFLSAKKNFNYESYVKYVWEEK